MDLYSRLVLVFSEKCLTFLVILIGELLLGLTLVSIDGLASFLLGKSQIVSGQHVLDASHHRIQAHIIIAALEVIPDIHPNRVADLLLFILEAGLIFTPG